MRNASICDTDSVSFVLQIGLRRPDSGPLPTVAPVASDATKTTLDAIAADLVTVKTDLARVLSHISSINNTLLLISDRQQVKSEVDPVEYFDVTDLGKPLGLSGLSVNRILIAIGLQTEVRKLNSKGRDVHGHYELTEKGREHGHAFASFKGKNGFQGRHVQWKPSIQPLIQGWIDGSKQS